MTQEQLDRILKGQMAYWVIATFLATALALFAKLVWTAHFPILIAPDCSRDLRACADKHGAEPNGTRFASPA